MIFNLLGPRSERLGLVEDGNLGQFILHDTEVICVNLAHITWKMVSRPWRSVIERGGTCGGDGVGEGARGYRIMRPAVV